MEKMKYIVVSFNFLTLSKAVIYAKEEWGTENTYILYTPTTNPFPDQFPKEYHSEVIPIPLAAYSFSMKKGHLQRLVEIAGYSDMAHRIFRRIQQIVPDVREPFTLVLFVDDNMREATVLELVKKHYEQCESWLIEEGVGIYRNPEKKDYRKLKSRRRWLYRLFGVSVYNMIAPAQGYNLLVDKILCRKPDLVKSRGHSPCAAVEKEIDIFTEENSNYLLNEIFHTGEPERGVQYVFLTQPFVEIGYATREEYHLCIRQILSILSGRGKVLIKPHPWDPEDYSQYVDDNVSLCSLELNKIPFECLLGCFRDARVIAFCSSSACNLDTSKSPVYLYRLLPGVAKNLRLPENFFEVNHIIDCVSLAQLEEIISTD